MVSEDLLANAKTAYVLLRTIEQLLVRDTVAGNPVDGEEYLNYFVLNALIECHKSVKHPVSAVIETLLIQTVYKAMNLLELINQFLNALIDNFRFSTPVAAFSKSEQPTLVKVQAKTEDRCLYFA